MMFGSVHNGPGITKVPIVLDLAINRFLGLVNSLKEMKTHTVHGTDELEIRLDEAITQPEYVTRQIHRDPTAIVEFFPVSLVVAVDSPQAVVVGGCDRPPQAEQQKQRAWNYVA